MSRAKYLKLLVWINGAVPGLILAWDAYHGSLGANSVSEALHTTGMLALIFLILALVITPLKRLTGRSELIATRRAFGLWGFYYACVHLGIYVGLDRSLDLASTLHELLTRRFLQVGLLGLLLMIPLAVTSTDAMVRKLGAKKWKKLHQLAYLATAAGVLHYYMQVKADVRLPIVFAIVLALLLIARYVWRDFGSAETTGSNPQKS